MTENPPCILRVLFGFPNTSLYSLCKEWLSLDDIGVLDSAICHHGFRQLFSAYISFDRFVFVRNGQVTNIAFLNWLKQRNMVLSALEIDCSREVCPPNFIYHKLMNSLQTLQISNYNNSVASFIISGSKEKCILTNLCFTNTHELSDGVLATLLSKCGLLKVLRLTNCTAITGSFMRTLQKYCISIQTIKLDGCKNLTAFQGFKPHILMPTLKEVSMTDSPRMNMGKTMLLLLTVAKNVIYLDIANSDSAKSVSLKTLECIVSKVPNLQLFYYNHCGNDELALLAKYCPNLENLTTHESAGINDINELIQSCSKLSDICLTKFVTEETLVTIATNCKNVTNLNLNLDNTNNSLFCSLSQYFVKLQKATFSFGYNINNTCFTAFTNSATQLTDLTLKMFFTLTDECLLALSINCKYLTRLAFTDCRGVTDVGFEYIAKNCEYLTHLKIGLIPDSTAATIITNATLQSFCLYQRNFTYFVFNHCQRFTVDGLCEFLAICGSKLVTFGINGKTVAARQSLYDIHYSSVGCPVGDVLLVTIINDCPNTVNLSLAHQYRFTLETVVQLKALKFLRSLTITPPAQTVGDIVLDFGVIRSVLKGVDVK